MDEHVFVVADGNDITNVIHYIMVIKVKKVLTFVVTINITNIVHEPKLPEVSKVVKDVFRRTVKDCLKGDSVILKLGTVCLLMKSKEQPIS